MLDQIRAEIRWALRRLRTSLGYAIVSVLTLGIGIGASTAIFSTVDGVLIESLPYRDASTLVQVWESSPARNIPTFGVAPGNLDDWRARVSSFSEVAASRPRRMILTQSDAEPERVTGEEVSSNYFQLLGVRTHLGRGLTAADSVSTAADPSCSGTTCGSVGSAAIPRSLANPSRSTARPSPWSAWLRPVYRRRCSCIPRLFSDHVLLDSERPRP